MINLPNPSTPTYKLTVPSTKKSIKYRPFLVKDEKNLLLIKESKNEDEISEALENIVSSCTFNEVNTDDLAIFDIEYIFLQLRAKSIGSIIELRMKCLNDIEDKGEEGEVITRKCNTLIDFNIDISKIEVITPENHTNVFILDKENNIGITFKYPGLKYIVKQENEDDADILLSLVDNIFDKDNVFDAKDIKKEQIEEFFGNMTKKQLDEIREKFIYNMPTIAYTEKYKCPGCGYEDEYTFKGLLDFF